MSINKEQFLTDNAGLIKKFANKYFFDTTKFSFDDLVQVGNQAAIKALDSFDDTRGIKPTTYVGTAVDRNICDFVRVNKFDVTYPVGAQRKHYNKSKETGEETKFIHSLSAVRLDCDYSGEMGDVGSWSQVLPSGSPPPEEKMMADEQTKILLEEIENLPEPQQRVIMGRYFGEFEFSELGSELGVSKQRAKQIEQLAFETLKIRLNKRLGGNIIRTDGLARR